MAIRFFNHSKKPQTAFVLGGGGNLGAIQVGQLRALIERGIIPDAVIGCSVGALNAAAVAGEPTLAEVDRLAELWKGLTRDNIFPSASRLGRGPWMFVRNGVSVFSNEGLRQVIERWLTYRRFEEARVPLSIVATSVHTGLEHWFESGDVVSALLASTALPGVFPPVDVGGQRFVDGGVVNNVPISRAVELGAKKIYVLDVGAIERERRAPRRPYEVLLQAVSIARAYRYRMDLDHIPAGVDTFHLPVPDTGGLRFDDFSRSQQLIERSYTLSAAYLSSRPVERREDTRRRLRGRAG